MAGCCRSAARTGATYVVAWNGLVYRAEKVGEKAALKTAVEALLKFEATERDDEFRERFHAMDVRRSGEAGRCRRTVGGTNQGVPAAAPGGKPTSR